MGRHTKTRHVDADNAHAVDDIGDQLQWHARRGRHAQVGNHNSIVKRRISHLVNGLANVLEQLAGDECFRTERHIADRAPRAIKVRSEGQTIDAARRARQDCCGPPHAQPDAQRTKGRAHRLRLVMRAFGVIGRIAIKNVGLAGLGGRVAHRVGAGVTAAIFRNRCCWHFKIEVVRHCRKRPQASAWFQKCRRACRPGSPA